jgi:predicted lipid-binding transport protein (Tim44 family)
MDTSVSVKTPPTADLDETQASTPTPNLCLVPLKSERARPTRYVRELASQTTKTSAGPDRLRAVEETRNNPIPFLIFAALVGLLLGSWWIGLLVGIGMTIIPGVAMLALVINNLLIRAVVGLFMVLGFPFYLAYSGVRRAVRGRPRYRRRGLRPSLAFGRSAPSGLSRCSAPCR